MNNKLPLFIIVGLTLILVSSVLTGCKSGTEAVVQTTSVETTQLNTALVEVGIEGTQWKLISLNDEQLISNSYISLYFRNGEIWGSAGINLYGGKYSIEVPGKLKFSEITVTLMGGPEDIANQEDVYFGHFHETVSYHVDGNRMEIANATNPNPLVFERLPEYPIDPSSLVDTKWQLVSLNKEPVLSGLSITLNFDSNMQASGQAGCFAYELPYATINGDDIRWGSEVHRTAELSREQEKQSFNYLDCISVAANYNLIKDKLEIFTARGDILVYKRQI